MGQFAGFFLIDEYEKFNIQADAEKMFYKSSIEERRRNKTIEKYNILEFAKDIRA